MNTDEPLDGRASPDRSQPVLEAVLNSFYPELVQSGRYSKERAVHLLSAVTVLSAALIAALTASGVSSASSLTKAVAVGAVVAWIAASLMFAWAASPPKPSEYPDISYDSPEILIDFVLSDSIAIQRSVERRLRWSITTTVVALIVSLAAFIAHVAAGSEVTWSAVEIQTLQPGSMLGSCDGGARGDTYIDLATLNDAKIAFKVVCPTGVATWFVNGSEVPEMKVR